MQFLKRLVVALVALAAIVVVVGFFLPSTVHLERETVINAPQSTVFALLNGFGRFNEWSPWAGLDPNTQYEYEGPENGVGASMSWTSENRSVGVGKQTIVASEPFDSVKTALDFGPQGTADAFFALSPEGDATKVVWGFDTDFGSNLIGRYFGLMMEGQLGPSYEQGLASLKTLAEGLPQANWSDLEVEMIEVESRPLAVVSGSSSQDSADIGTSLGNAYAQVNAFLAEHDLQAAGAPVTINKTWDEAGYTFDAGIPLAVGPAEEATDGAEVRVIDSYAGKALRATHRGAYENMPQTYEKIEAYLAAHGLESDGYPWDEWVSDQGTPEEELVTYIYFPLS